jgi:V/A-type H+-transporting ATPase subunit C
MAESLINSIARLRVNEKNLLAKETVARLAAAPSYEESVRVLRESGWGQSAAQPEEKDEIDALIRARLSSAYALVSELMPERLAPVTDVFRMRHDLTNIKLLYKLRLMGQELAGARLDFGGVFPEKELKAGMQRGDYSMLPKKLSDALEELDVSTYHGADPQKVSLRLDRAFIEYAGSVRNPFVKEYFGALADFTNVLAVIRGVGEEELLPGGEISKAELCSFGEQLRESGEKALSILKGGISPSPLREAVCRGFSEYLRAGSTAALERERDEYLIALASEGRSDIDTVRPIVGYLLANEREAEVVRLILTAKRSGIPMSAIDERSLRLYG